MNKEFNVTYHLPSTEGSLPITVTVGATDEARARKRIMRRECDARIVAVKEVVFKLIEPKWWHTA